MKCKKLGLRRFFYHLSIVFISLVSAAALALGSALVSVNCHNTVSSDRLEFIRIEYDGDRPVIILAGKRLAYDGN